MVKHLAPAFVLVAALLPQTSAGQDVQLNPGYISGTVQVGNLPIDYAYLRANWTASDGTPYEATTSTSGVGGTSLSYTLTVNVPSGAAANYSIYAEVYLSNYTFFLRLPAQQTAVTEFQTSTANFDVTPGFIDATVTVTGASFSSVYFYSYGQSGDYAYASYSVPGTDASLTMPVVPGSQTAYGYLYTGTGQVPVVDSMNALPAVQMWGPVACGVTTGGVEVPVSDAGASGYHYDPTTHVWGYNLKATGMAPGCYLLQVTSVLSNPSALYPIQIR